MSNWQHFLDAQGATRSANGEIAFNKPQDSASQAAANTYLTELGYQGLLAFDGPDAAKFLQGQVTADVRELANGYWKLGAQCNLKGRMEASFALAQTNPEQILLRCHASLTDSLAQHLQKYAEIAREGSGDVKRAAGHLESALGALGELSIKGRDKMSKLQQTVCRHLTLSRQIWPRGDSCPN